MFSGFHAIASTFYVSMQGNNSHSGSQQTPWETLQFAASQLEAGDTLMVMAGHYVGFDMDGILNKTGN